VGSCDGESALREDDGWPGLVLIITGHRPAEILNDQSPPGVDPFYKPEESLRVAGVCGTPQPRRAESVRSPGI